MNEFAKGKINDSSIVLACSALKEIYRGHLCKGMEENCCLIFLQGSYETIFKRLQQRQEHYMPSSLLQSQFDALEEPTGATVIDISLAPQTIVEQIIKATNQN